MGSRGGNAPNPYPRRSTSTHFLRVPVEDWARVTVGEKTEFRTVHGSKLVLQSPLPTPVVAYTLDGTGNYDKQMMVLEAHRYEPVFLITEYPESIAREGFDSYEEFRTYWRARNRSRTYRPTQKVHVWQIRRWTMDDYTDMALRTLDLLYGEFLGDLEPSQLSR